MDPHFSVRNVSTNFKSLIRFVSHITCFKTVGSLITPIKSRFETIFHQGPTYSLHPGGGGAGGCHMMGCEAQKSQMELRAFVHSFIDPLIHSFIHSLIDSSIHSFMHPFTHLLIHSFIQIHAIPCHAMPCNAIP